MNWRLVSKPVAAFVELEGLRRMGLVTQPTLVFITHRSEYAQAEL
jgi:hypothetical protein